MTEEQCSEILDNYFSAGGRYIDTAPTYSFGWVEEFLGNYLSRRPRDSFVISTSCGYVRDGTQGFRVSGAKEDVLKDAEESLSRLQLDSFDIYISHIPDLNSPLEETAQALQSLKDRGLASEIGVSNVDGSQLRRYLNGGEISVVQNRFSYLNRSLDPSLSQVITDNGIKMIAYQVLERGLLTADGPTINADSDLRLKKPEFEVSKTEWILASILPLIRDLALEVGKSVESLVVSWTISNPEVSLVQIGATTALQASAIPTYPALLDRDVRARLDEIYDSAEREVKSRGFLGIRDFLGLASYDVRSGSASGK